MLLKQKPTRQIEVSVIEYPHLRVLENRCLLGNYLNELGFETGIELGVQRGTFANTTLNKWKKCKRYHLVDAWQHQSTCFGFNPFVLMVWLTLFLSLDH